MELKEYLSKSKLKRKNLVKQASNYLQKLESQDLNSPNILTESAYNGPNPLKFMEFEHQIYNQLQKLYSSKLLLESISKPKPAISFRQKITTQNFSVQANPAKQKLSLTSIPKSHKPKNTLSLPVNPPKSSSFQRRLIKTRDAVRSLSKLTR